MTVGRYPWRRAVHVISTPNISLFDKNATPESRRSGVMMNPTHGWHWPVSDRN